MTDYYIPPRDFVGYGLEPPKFEWPGGNKIAISFVLNYEEGAESTPWNCPEETSCSYLHEMHYDREVTQPGKRDAMVEEIFEYGIRQGFPRLFKLFKKYGWNWTTWACARSFEVTGDYPRLIVNEGHEVACHGNRWTMHGSNTAEEKANIHKAFDRLQATTGRSDVPTGWFLGNGGPRQKLSRAEVHKERGLPPLYCSDTYAGDSPWWIPNPLAKAYGEEDDGMLMIPYSLCTNDQRFFVKGGTGVSSPEDFFELLKGEFDQLYEEGQAGSPRMMTIALHNRFICKPGRIMALKRFMAYIATQPDVWVCTRSEIAAFWREKFPYNQVGPTYSLHNDQERD